MAMRISFLEDGVTAFLEEGGRFAIPKGNEDSLLHHRYKLVDDKLVDRWPGLNDEEVTAANIIEAEATNLASVQDGQISIIKGTVATRIAATDWKIDRAKEQDAVNGTDTLSEVYAEREALRQRSNDIEVAIRSMTDSDSIYRVRFDTFVLD